MSEHRHRCEQCRKLIPHRHNYFVLYEAATNYIYYFCSWWHFVRWRFLKVIRRLK